MNPEQQTNPSVLLIDSDDARATLMIEALKTAAFEVVHIADSGFSLLRQVDQVKPDIIVIDTESPDRDMLESLDMMSTFNPRPVVMFSDKHDKDIIDQTVRSGVSAYVGRDVSPERLKPIIDVAVARFTHTQQLKNELQTTKEALQHQQNIAKAKRLLIKQKSMTEEQAYAAMRKMAMNNGQKIEQVAANIISLLKD